MVRVVSLGLIALAIGVGTLASCDEPVGAYDGPLGLEVVSGDGQVVAAGQDSLAEPVVLRAHEAGNPGNGVADVLTCARPVGDAPLNPLTQCSNTGPEGLVRFWFAPGTTTTDSACAEVRAEQDGQTASALNICSIVEPGPLDWLDMDTSVEVADIEPGDTVDLKAHIADGFRSARDVYGNNVSLDRLLSIQATTVETQWFDAHNDWDFVLPFVSGWKPVIPDTAGFRRVYNNDGSYKYSFDLRLAIDLLEQVVGRWFARYP